MSKRRIKGESSYPLLNDYKWLYLKYLEEKLNTYQIAEIVGCSESTALRALNRCGIPTRTTSEARRKYEFDEEWLVKKYWGEKLSIKKIADIVGCETTPVWRALKRFGIPIRNLSEAGKCETYKKYPLLDDKEWLCQQYLEEKRSMDEIAEIVGCDSSLVSRALTSFDIPTRTPSEVQKKKIHVDKEWLWQEYIGKKTGSPEIAKKFGCSAVAIRNALKRFNIPIRTRGEARRQYEVDEGWLRQKYLEEKLSMQKIAKIVGCNRATVWNALRRCGIPIRSLSEARKHHNFKTHHTKPERIFEAICKKYNLQFKYTGDGAFWIGKNPSVNPDFVECNGKKIAIEIFSYWHDPLKRHCKIPFSQTYEGRKKILKKYGWKLIVFWDADILEEDAEAFVLAKLKKEKII